VDRLLLAVSAALTVVGWALVGIALRKVVGGIP